MAAMLEADGLTKYFRHQWTWRRFCVLDDFDLQVEQGEIFGLIGPNGAGKTTTFKLLLGLLRPTRGQIRFCGGPLDGAARAAIGFLPEQPYFYDYLTVEETLYFYARLYGLAAAERHRRVAEVIEQVRLTAKRRAAMRTLSKGTLQRVGIAQAILNRPRLTILDEPMSGLDPAGRHQMRELILSLQRAGTTVIFSSHILPDAEALCTRVGILAQGRLREVLHLRDGGQPTAYVLTVSNISGDTLTTLERIALSPPAADGRSWVLRLRDQIAVSTALAEIGKSGGLVESLTPVHPSLEERFLAYVEQAGDSD
jgi:ABC-2 type transport system ATP-binding protein